MTKDGTQAPLARVTLRAYPPAPARVELVYRPLLTRLARAALCLMVLWGIIPLLFWVPPVYPWIVAAFIAGSSLAYRQCTGRYRVKSFAGICPRCGHPLSLGVDHIISLPHPLTCFHCHFEPYLEVRFTADAAGLTGSPEHRTAACTGLWELRWLADEPYVVCNRCRAGGRASPDARRAADEENARAATLAQLTREGRWAL